MATNCISLRGSTSCPEFASASISTDATIIGLYPFLSSVRDTASFDSGLQNYIANGFSQQRYQQLIGCSNIDLSNTTDLYARFTTSVLCNAIVQNSIQPCSLSGNATEPLCAETCAEYARSEQQIASTPQICGTSGSNAVSEIRADFTNCALPQGSLSQSCIQGALNEPDNCGFSNNLGGLCTYCAASSPNNTDACCLFSHTEQRCANVHLAITTSMPPVFPIPTSTASPNGTSGQGLTAGQIAGIVVGSVLGALVLLALVIGCCVLLRRRSRSKRGSGSVLNTLSPARSPAGMPMAFRDGATSTSPARYGIVGGRVARMSALEREGEQDQGYHDSPESGLREPPKRSGSLSSGSHLGALAAAGTEDDSSPQSNSNNEYSSPEGVGSGQSEQLAFFKDYYSQDEIRPGDKVAVLWAYQPRAVDEFELERGDMLKVVGIWDDGWATGVRLMDNAEDWEDDRHNPQRDSGMSNGSSRSQESPTNGEIKAFPLVCICLPEHWRKTIEGESAENTGDPGRQPSP